MPVTLPFYPTGTKLDADLLALANAPGGGSTSDDVTNESTVAGTTVTDALDTLSGSSGIENQSDPFLGLTVTDALFALEALISAIPAPTLPGSIVSTDFDGGAVGVGAAFTTILQTGGVAGKTLNAGITAGQLVVVLMNAAGGGELIATGVTYTEDGSTATARASVLLIWVGTDWQLIAGQGVTIT